MKRREFSNEEEIIFNECVFKQFGLYKISKLMNIDADVLMRIARERGIKYLQPHLSFNADTKSKIKELYETTDMSVGDIERVVGHKDVQGYIIDTYPKKIREERHRRLLSMRLSENNYMSGRTEEKHPNYKGIVSDGKGYQMILKPCWYEGRVGCKHIYYHHYVYCLETGLKKIPDGYVVHHIDGNKTNNNINNLALMTCAAHSRLHAVQNKLKSNKQSAETIESID